MAQGQVVDTIAEMIAPGLEPALAHAPSIAALVRDGDMAALGKLYDEHHVAVRLFARRLLGEAAAEDLVHDTFLTLPKALRRFSGDSSLRTFILGVAVNHARHRVRSGLRLRFALERFAREPTGTSLARPDGETEQRRLAAMLQRALESLSFEHRTAFVLCEVEERSSPEVAQILSIPEATVRTRLHHARQKLRVALERQGVR